MEKFIEQTQIHLKSTWDRLGDYVDDTTEELEMPDESNGNTGPHLAVVADNTPDMAVNEPLVLGEHLGDVILKFEAVSKSFGDLEDKVDVLDGVELEVREKELLAILGFSGSGKTTLINLIAGLQAPSQGTVTLRGDIIEGPGPDRGLIFQTYSLMPWLTVRQNVMMAIDEVFPKDSKEAKLARADKYISMVGLGHAVDRRPAELSGGMRQRVNVARALSMEPEILLLDEPLSALDALTRAKLQDDVARIVREEGKTAVLITNDVEEALIMADRIVPLTTAPRARMGKEFTVQLAVPGTGFRDRLELADNQAFTHQRREITEYLLALGAEKENVATEQGDAPNITPIHDELPPKAYRDEARAMMPKRYLEFYNVKKTYPTPKGPLTVVDGFDFVMEKGDFVSIIGHSGCGKSTVLTMAAGLNPVSDGGIVLDGNEVVSAGPDRAVVFQSPSLMPWLTAFENVMLGLPRVYPKVTKAQQEDVAKYYLTKVGLSEDMNKLARDMSNGMQQRVGIARAFALSPKLLLLDEPFGMLDSMTRWSLQEVLMQVWKRTQVTTVCVTHDVDEAILLSDKVIMMTNGPNARIGKVLEVKLPRPRSRKALLAHPDYEYYRGQVLEFLDEYEHGATSKKDAPVKGTEPKAEDTQNAA